MKYAVIILDGAAGWPLDELGGKTCLEAAETPVLDSLAREGLLGMARTIPAGTEPSSAAACTSILGYDPVASYVGRGAIEATSMGIRLEPGQVAMRLNLVTLDDGIMRSYSCGHISTEEAHELVAELDDALSDGTFAFYPGVAYRHILVVSHHAELLDGSYTPPHDISDKPITGHIPRGPGSELLTDLMERARPILAESQTNRRRIASGKLAATDVWPFWPGVAPTGLVPFEQCHGVSAAMTSGVDLLNGLATLFGVSRLEIPGVTDGSDNDYAAQAEGAMRALVEHDLVVVHVESPDEEGHAGDVVGKIRAIEEIDRHVVARFAEHGGDIRILAMPDHPTPVAIKTHTAEPVPFVLWGQGVEPNRGECFCEAAAEVAEYVVDPGRGVMELLLEEIDE
jgi:2,3-bisphosphoglycerate-independent phosphoglycerate mutase